MAAWLTVVKAALPYVTQIVTAAIPTFTRPKNESDDVVPAQIAELQGAATRNAESILALEAQLKQTARLVIVALVVAALAIGVAIYALVRS